MLFKDLKVGDTIYVNNPKQWNKPIKKTISKILSYGTDSLWIEFYDENGDYIGDALSNRAHGISSGLFADFDAFKKFWTDYYTQKVEQIQDERQEIINALVSAVNDLSIATHMEEEN